ncbi:hypothetical protein D9619_006025 [Psilocybe cf. subviscida]|uniref:Uncharacterized protein n=1 Tax=Psilocybe cf. subviscida TaxID=2480587 RepID=A0A8H5BWD2_9AGAR|nr:hypothetical protein D9619_006025 [Psilocybe cf. subviscida]
MTKPKPDPAVLEAEAKKKAEGYTTIVCSSGMSLRHRPNVAAPPPPVKKDPKPAHSVNNLAPGRVTPWPPLAPQHAWRVTRRTMTTTCASSMKHTPASAAQAAIQRPHAPAAHPHPGPESHNPAHNTEHFRNNLATFNAAHPPHAPAHGMHHAKAPARLQHNVPSTSHQVTLPHHPAPPHHGSSSGGSKTGKKSGK